MRVVFPIFLCLAASGSAKEVAMGLHLSTPAFTEGAAIPARFTGDGADLSPAMQWSGAPSGTQAFALIMDDPDAPVGTWIHWVAFDLPGASTGLSEGQPRTADLPSGGHQGKNSWGRLGYNGPAPPPGKAHRYFFRLYALSAPLRLSAGASRAEVDRAMSGKVLGHAEVMGTFRR